MLLFYYDECDLFCLSTTFLPENLFIALWIMLVYMEVIFLIFQVVFFNNWENREKREILQQ